MKTVRIVMAMLSICGCVAVRGLNGGETADPSGVTGPRDPVQDDVSTLPPLDDNATLDAYLQHAFLNNPGLKAAFRRWQAASERIPQARALDDPQLTYEHFIKQEDLRFQLGVSQSLPTLGKRDLKAREASAEAETAKHEYEAVRLMIFDKVTRAFSEYRFLGRSIAVTEEDDRLLADLEKITRARYETGSVRFSDLTRVQIEQEKIRNELISMEEERRAMSDKLAALLNISTPEALPWPAAETQTGVLIDDQILFNMIEDLNPELKVAQFKVRKSEFAERLARMSRIPDFMIGVNLMAMPKSDNMDSEYDLSVMAGITLPLWFGKNAAMIREAGAMLEAERQESLDMLNSLRVDLRMALFQFRDSERRIKLLRDSLIPKAMQAYEVTRKEFSAGKAEFMSVADARRTVLEFKISYERALVDQELAMAEIGCCIGKYGDSLKQTISGTDDRPTAGAKP